MLSKFKRKVNHNDIHTIFVIITWIRPCACSDWSKTNVLSEYKTYKKRVSLFCVRKIYIIKQMKKPKPCITLTVIKHCGHLRTLEKCRKHSPAARVFYISLMFSNSCHVLSQCNTRLRLLHLVNNYVIIAEGNLVWLISLPEPFDFLSAFHPVPVK